jgi:hypothetical protein
MTSVSVRDPLMAWLRDIVWVLGVIVIIASPNLVRRIGVASGFFTPELLLSPFGTALTAFGIVLIWTVVVMAAADWLTPELRSNRPESHP